MEQIETSVYELGSNLNTKVLVPDNQGVFIIEQDQMDDEGNTNGVVGQFGFPIEQIPFLIDLLGVIYIGAMMVEGEKTIN